MKIVQVDLRNQDNETLTTWLEKRPYLKEGADVTLKDLKPDIKWRVVKIYPMEHESADFDWHRKWDNNI